MLWRKRCQNMKVCIKLEWVFSRNVYVRRFALIYFYIPWSWIIKPYFIVNFFISFYQYFHESDIDFISGQSSALSIAFSGRHVIRQVIRLQGFSDITRLTDANTVYIIKIGLSRSSIKWFETFNTEGFRQLRVLLMINIVLLPASTSKRGQKTFESLPCWNIPVSMKQLLCFPLWNIPGNLGVCLQSCYCGERN